MPKPSRKLPTIQSVGKAPRAARQRIAKMEEQIINLHTFIKGHLGIKDEMQDKIATADIAIENLTSQTAKLKASLHNAQVTILKLETEKMGVRAKYRGLLGDIKQAINNEPELPGRLPFDIRVQTLLHPTRILRRVVQETKSSLYLKVFSLIEKQYPSCASDFSARVGGVETCTPVVIGPVLSEKAK